MINVTVIDKVYLTDSICRLRMKATDSTALPLASAGSHIDVHLGNGCIRQYSLCCEHGADYYEIAVLKEENGRGGSTFIHEEINEGDEFQISEPKNLFPLAANANESILIAAGVGVTPILSMAETLHREGKPFTMHYCSKNEMQTAYKKRIDASSFVDRVQYHFSEINGRMPLNDAICSARDGLHLYVCGPTSFTDSVIHYASENGWGSSNIHREYFSAAPIENGNEQSFEIEIKSTGDIYTVPADQSILEVLEEEGIFIPVACEQGVCGSCITGLLSGEADHKDVFMTKDEHSIMNKITPCCSRAKSSRLTLDL